MKTSGAVRGGALVIGLAVVGLFAWFFGEARQLPQRDQVLTSEADAADRPLPDKPATPEPDPLVRQKELFQKLHPGMEVPEDFEESVDFTTLPLPERRERYEKALIAHMRESLDFDWATTHEAGLTSEFDALARDSDAFEFVRSECRSSSCVVRVAWEPGLGEAAYSLLVSSPLGLGCRLQMLPPEQDATEAAIYLDCTRQRERERTAVPMVATVRGEVPTHPPGMAHSSP